MKTLSTCHIRVINFFYNYIVCTIAVTVDRIHYETRLPCLILPCLPSTITSFYRIALFYLHNSILYISSNMHMGGQFDGLISFWQPANCTYWFNLYEIVYLANKLSPRLSYSLSLIRWHPASIEDPAYIGDPASIRSFTVYSWPAVMRVSVRSMLSVSVKTNKWLIDDCQSDSVDRCNTDNDWKNSTAEPFVKQTLNHWPCSAWFCLAYMLYPQNVSPLMKMCVT